MIAKTSQRWKSGGSSVFSSSIVIFSDPAKDFAKRRFIAGAHWFVNVKAKDEGIFAVMDGAADQACPLWTEEGSKNQCYSIEVLCVVVKWQIMGGIFRAGTSLKIRQLFFRADSSLMCPCHLKTQRGGHPIHQGI